MRKTTITAQDCITLKIALDTGIAKLAPHVEGKEPLWEGDQLEAMREWLEKQRALSAKLQRKIDGK